MIIPPLVLCLGITALQVAAHDDRQADTVRQFDFDQSAMDVNYDAWPDGWSRLRGPGYPGYIKIEIVHPPDDGGSHGSSHLRIDLDGGAAAVFSPRIDISPQFSFVLEGYVKTERLRHHAAYLTLNFYSHDDRPLGTLESQRLTRAGDWTRVHVGPVTPDRDAHYAIIGLHLSPGEKGDLFGAAMFDRLWLGSLPRMVMEANRDFHLYDDPSEVEVRCEVSGVGNADSIVTFELFDVDGQLVHSEQRRLGDPNLDHRPATVFGLPRVLTNAPSSPAPAPLGHMTWRPRLPDYGFYTLRASLDAGHRALERRITIAVLQKLPRAEKGEFGWSLPDGEDPVPINLLTPLLARAGIHWIKFPAWYASDDERSAENLAWFADRLGSEDIEMIGMLDEPPADARRIFDGNDNLSVASVFLDPEWWRPNIDPVMIRLSLKVRWWQLGRDDDTSFVEFQNLEQKIREVKHHLEQFGQKTQLGFAWRWMTELPAQDNVPWDFLACTESPPFTADELSVYMAAAARPEQQLWVTVRPLPRAEYDVQTRAHDLVARILSAKINKAAGVFLPDPFNAETGVMNPDGTPGELFLPWRTAATLMAGARYAGAINMPNGSQNYVFAKGDQAVMVVWNRTPATEKIFLGTQVQQIDLWGRTVALNTVVENDREYQQIEIGPMPKFLTGVNLPIALWRIQFTFDTKQLESVFGRQQPAIYRFKNTFDRGVGGKVTLVAPEVWETDHRPYHFKLAADEEQTEQFIVLLRAEASSGEQSVRMDFDITADRRYQFSIYRTIQVGLGDVLVELATRLDESGDLVVEQHMTNKTDDFLSFNCLLFAPNRRRERQQVLNMGRGRTTNTFVFENGAELIGKSLLLRAEEIGGSRLLNYKIIAEQ